MKNSSCIRRNDICGTMVTAANGDPVFHLFADENWKTAKYICFSNAHTIAEAVFDRNFRTAVNNAWMCLPSGMPVCALGNMLYGKNVYKRTFGADFMAECLNRSEELNLTHFFYGSTHETLDRITAKYSSVCGHRILGCIAPPFGEISQSRLAHDFSNIRESGAKIIWVGLRAPKQELFMYNNLQRLSQGIMVGVGAAFEYEAGIINRAPVWMQENGLQWVYRLSQSPKRLWKRYLFSNTLFLLAAAVCLIKNRSTSNTGEA